MSSLARLICAACLVATVALLAGASAGSAAAPLKSCPLSITKSQQLGATYVLKLKAGGVSCSGAVDVVKAFNTCRRKKGVAGRCSRKVKQYSCTDTRPAAEQIPTQINGHVKCKRGAKRVNFDFQQNR